MAMPPPRCTVCPLRRTGFCGSFSDADLPRLAAASRRRHIAKGDRPFEEGEPAQIVFNICAGHVKLAKLLPDGRQFVTRFAGPGELVVFAERYDVTVIALEESDICEIARPTFDRMVREHPAVMAHALHDSQRSLRRAEDRMLLLGRKHALERVAAFLIEQAEDRGPTTLHLAMTRQDIADYLGLTLETVSRCLTQLRKHGVIGMPSPADVLVVRAADLHRVADGYGMPCMPRLRPPAIAGQASTQLRA